MAHQQVSFITNVRADIIGESDTFGMCYHYLPPHLSYEGTCSSRRNAFTTKNCLVCGYTVRLSSRHQAQHFPKRFHQLQATFATFIPSRLSRPQLLGAVSTTSKHPSTAYLPSFEGRQIIQAKASMTDARWTATSFRARGSALCLSSCHLVHNSVCSDCCHNIRYRPRSLSLDANQQPQQAENRVRMHNGHVRDK